jgi:Fe-S oxidoreductase
MAAPDWVPYVLTVFLAVSLGIFVNRLAFIVRLLRAGRATEKRWDHFGQRLAALISLGILQRKVYRSPPVGLLHSFIFWAFVILGASILEITAQGYAPGWQIPVPEILRGPLYLAEEIVAVLAVVGVGMALYRRYVVRPKKLMHEGFLPATLILLYILGIVATVLFYNAAEHARGIAAAPAWKPASALLADVSVVRLAPEFSWWFFWAAHVLLLFSFLAYVPYSKHSHILFALFNSFWVDLEPRGAIRPIDLEKTETFGVQRVEQLSLRQLLDGFACTECGRCTDNCPANATGKTLDPMHFIVNMRDTLLEQGPAILAGKTEGLPNMFATVHSEDAIWACTTCYACVHECPVMNEHVPKIIDMRRHMVLMEGKMPPEAMGAMRNIETNYNPWGIGWDQRGKWAEGLGVRTMSEVVAAGETVDVLYWVGCAGSFDDRNRKVSQSFARLLQKAGVRFAILGPEEKCTGDPARRMGNEYIAQMMVKANVETLNRYGVKKVVTACPHCFNAIRHEYPDFGGSYEVVHHSEFLAGLLREGNLKPTKEVRELLTYHDACYLGRYNKVYDEPREVLLKIPGVQTVEMEKCRDKGFCCGAGGARMWMEETTGERVNHRRLSHVLETGAKTVATACPYCLIMMDDAAKTKDVDAKLARVDIAEILERSV